ncbi:uncharacterized protein LOC110873568 [Helianthus annuus]|uniref:uncharacterized protein LOC110873568 n=1 Tax=Helianthus annuus TaxID=4232 RepID=UPI000B908A90|nr:uncharacterized protein LOC110873568 [Helianthus annuus]
MAELKVSLAKPGLRSDGVSVWEWSGSALDEGDETAKWFTDFLGKPSCLVRFNEGTHYQSEDAAIGSQPRKTMMKFRSAEALELNTTTTKYKGQMANTPLHVAASHNSVEVVKFLLNFARPETVDLEPKNRMIKMERNLLKPVVMKLQRFFSLTGLPPKPKKIME